MAAPRFDARNRDDRNPFSPTNLRLLDGERDADLVARLRGDGGLLFDLVEQAEGLVILTTNHQLADAATDQGSIADERPTGIPNPRPPVRGIQRLLTLLG